jgi:hypothetical protein
LQWELSIINQQSSINNRIASPPGDKQAAKAHNLPMTVRRLKTYAGAQGYVYQYYFVGKRAALADDPAAPATEFIFDVTSDRELTYAVSVFLPDRSVAEWSATHGRPLNDAEQYAAVKLRLFRAFDELEDVKAHGRRLTIDQALLEEALSSLGVE